MGDRQNESQWHRWLEWCGYAQCFFSMNSQVSSLAVPAYNFPLGLWALYCAHTKNGRNVFAFLCFMVYSAIMDITYFALWSDYFGLTSTGGFAVAMLVFNLFAKFGGLFCAYQLFVELGGAWAMRAGSSSGGGADGYRDMNAAAGYAGPAPVDGTKPIVDAQDV